MGWEKTAGLRGGRPALQEMADRSGMMPGPAAAGVKSRTVVDELSIGWEKTAGLRGGRPALQVCGAVREFLFTCGLVFV